MEAGTACVYLSRPIDHHLKQERGRETRPLAAGAKLTTSLLIQPASTLLKQPLWTVSRGLTRRTRGQSPSMTLKLAASISSLIIAASDGAKTHVTVSLHSH